MAHARACGREGLRRAARRNDDRSGRVDGRGNALRNGSLCTRRPRAGEILARGWISWNRLQRSDQPRFSLWRSSRRGSARTGALPMKRLLLVALFATTAAARPRALLIGINDYGATQIRTQPRPAAPGREWPDLAGAVNDVHGL